MTASAVAAALNISLNVQFQREAGKVSMPIAELARYAAVLGSKRRS
jgi:hypothetical protein